MKPLKRHPALIGLSRDHHHSLALCVRILRSPASSHQAEIEAHIPDLLKHFLEEETVFAPHWEKIGAALRSRFDSEHALLRGMVAAPQYADEAWNKRFATVLRDHARFEERELFPAIEPFLDGTLKSITNQ